MAAAENNNHHDGHISFDDEENELDDTDGDYTDMDDSAAAPVGDPPPAPLPPPAMLRMEERRPTPSLDESRRLFQRLWAEDDEIKILRRFLDFTSSRGTTFASHQYDTGPFYEQIRAELQLDFNKNQLIEKLRRLKKKYRNTAGRMAAHGRDFSFKSPHEKEIYDIAKRIWSAGVNRTTSRDNSDDDDELNTTTTSDAKTASSKSSRRRGRKRSLEALHAAAQPELPALPPPESVVKVEVQTAPITTQIVATPIAVAPPIQTSVGTPPAIIISAGVIEETVKSCLSPIIKELLSSAASTPPPFGFGPPLLHFGGGNLGKLSSDDNDKWKKQQILELEVYLKRVELLRDQIQSTLEDLKASATGS